MLKKRNKAFTLVEMLAVIVILGLIMLISFPKILGMVEGEKKQISDAQLQLVYTAAKSYIYDYSNQFPAREGKSYCISVDTLDKANYLSIEKDGLEDEGKAVKISYFSDEEYQLTYVNRSDCTDKVW